MKLECKSREVTAIIVTCVPPRTNSRRTDEFEETTEDILKSLSRLLKSDRRTLLLGDSNCEEVDWETSEDGTRGG